GADRDEQEREPEPALRDARRVLHAGEHGGPRAPEEPEREEAAERRGDAAPHPAGPLRAAARARARAAAPRARTPRPGWGDRRPPPIDDDTGARVTCLSRKCNKCVTFDERL